MSSELQDALAEIGDALDTAAQLAGPASEALDLMERLGEVVGDDFDILFHEGSPAHDLLVQFVQVMRLRSTHVGLGVEKAEQEFIAAIKGGE